MPRNSPNSDSTDEPFDLRKEYEEQEREAHKRRLKQYKKMGIGQRKEVAFSLFVKGYTNAEVAREIGIHPDTVTRYRRSHEERLTAEAAANPHLLRDVLGNTLRSLEELDRVRMEAWKQYEAATSATVKKDFLNVITKAQSERAKLFGLMGVKQDTLVYINGVKQAQDKIMDFMAKELCAADRRKLEAYLVEVFSEELAGVETPADLTGD